MSVCRHCNTTVDTAELRCCVVTKEKFCPVCYEQHLAGCGGCREAAFVPPLWREPVVRPKGHGKTVLLQGVPVLLGANLAPAAAWPPHAPTPPPAANLAQPQALRLELWGWQRYAWSLSALTPANGNRVARQGPDLVITVWSGAPPALLDDVVETLLASIPAAGGWCKGGGLTVVTLGAILRRGSQVYLASADVGHDAYSVILTWEEPTAEPPPGPPAETAAQFWATVTARVAAAASPAAPPPAPAAAAPAAVAAAPPGQRELWLVVSRQRPATWFISHDEVLDIAHPQAWLLWRGNPVLLPDTLLPPLLAVLVSAQDWHLDAGPASTLLPQVQAGQSASLAHCFLAPQNSAYYVQLTWTAPNIPLEPPANIAAICAGLRTALVRLPLMHYLLSLVDHPAPPSGRTLANNQTRVIFPLLTTPPHHPGGPTRNGSAPAQHKEEDYP